MGIFPQSMGSNDMHWQVNYGNWTTMEFPVFRKRLGVLRYLYWLNDDSFVIDYALITNTKSDVTIRSHLVLLFLSIIYSLCPIHNRTDTWRT